MYHSGHIIFISVHWLAVDSELISEIIKKIWQQWLVLLINTNDLAAMKGEMLSVIIMMMVAIMTGNFQENVLSLQLAIALSKRRFDQKLTHCKLTGYFTCLEWTYAESTEVIS